MIATLHRVGGGIDLHPNLCAVGIAAGTSSRITSGAC
jgi:hypothetical protein